MSSLKVLVASSGSGRAASNSLHAAHGVHVPSGFYDGYIISKLV